MCSTHAPYLFARLGSALPFSIGVFFSLPWPAQDAVAVVANWGNYYCRKRPVIPVVARVTLPRDCQGFGLGKELAGGATNTYVSLISPILNRDKHTAKA